MFKKIKNNDNIDEHHNIYLIKSYGVGGVPICKYGYSSKINSRIKNYRNHNPLMEIIGTGYAADGQKYERYIHSFHEAIFGDEWYGDDKIAELTAALNQEGYENKNGKVEFAQKKDYEDPYEKRKRLYPHENIITSEDKLEVMERALMDDYIDMGSPKVSEKTVKILMGIWGRYYANPSETLKINK